MTDTIEKDPESRLRALDRTLKALRNSSKALVRATDESSLLNEVCRIIVEDCGHAMVWVGYVENNPDKSIRPVAYSGFESGYLEKLQLTWDDAERGRGPTGRAIRTGTVCLCRNMLTDPAFTPWRGEALRRGYASSIALPLAYGGEVLGALTIYSPETDPFSEDEVRLLTSLSDDLAFGICALRLRQSNLRTQEALHQKDVQFRMLFETACDGIIFLDPQGRFLDANPQGLNLLGVSRQELLGKHVADLVVEQEQSRVAEALAAMRSGRPHVAEWQFIRKDGAVLFGEFKGRLMPDGNIVGILHDTTESKRTQRERDLTIAFLRMANQSKSCAELLRMAVLFFKQHADCDAVGIRLREGDDFPYSQTLGFSNAFLEAEHSLCSHCEPEGKISLACLCGKVITGGGIPETLSLTGHGSFWSNDSTALTAQGTFSDQDLIRGRCIQEGYGSIALLPLHDGPLRIGLLQLNARKKGAFTLEALSLWERLADHLAVAVAKLQAEAALRVSETLNRQTLQALPAHIAVIDRNGRVEAVNDAWSEFAGGNNASETTAVQVGANYLEACRRAAAANSADAAQALAGIEGVLTGTRQQFTFEYPCHSPQERRWFLMTVTPLGGCGENGAVISHFNITDRKRAEQQLFETSQRLQALMTAVPVGISFSEDATCRHISGNPTALAQFEVAPMDNLSASADATDAPGRQVQFFSGGRPITDTELPLQRAVAENSMIPTMELEVHLPSGRRWIAEASGAPVYDAQGLVIGGIAVTVDITERKQTEESLRASENLFRAAFEGSSIPMSLTAPDGRMLRVNAPFCRMLGYSETELLTLTIYDFTHPDDLSTNRIGIQKMLNGEQTSFQMEKRYRRKDGSILWADMSTSFVRSADGYPLYMVTHVQDISDRKLAEEQVRFQARLLEAVGQAVVSTDLNQRITYWNKAATALFGWTAAEALGRSLIELTQPDTTAAMDGELKETLRQGQTWSRELQLRRKDGTAVSLLTTNAPVLNEKGELSAIIGVGVDLTERKQTEEVLRFLGQCPSGGAGEGFFQQLARYLAQTLGMDYVCIDRLEEDRLSARTLAVFHNGEFEDNVSYTLKDTPCGSVVGKRICCFPQNICKLFPTDEVLQQLKAESYLGTTLWSSQGKPIGLIAVIGRQPLKDTRQAESVLQMVAVRAAGELERLQAEAALRESEERYRLLFQNVQEGFYLAEPVFEGDTCCDAVYLEVNAAFERIIGCQREQIIGRRITELVPETRPEWLEVFGQVALTGEPASHQAYSETFRKHFESFIFRPAPRQFAVLVSDITRRKQFEQAITRLNAQLEDRVAKRTEELAFTNRELEAFCYSVSHDLRAPLRSMDGFSQALLEDYSPLLDATGHDFLNRIRSNCQRMARLVDDLLDLSRLSRSQMRHQPVDLTALAHAVIADLRQAEPDRAVEVRVAPELVATGDQVLLRTAIGNLLHNAWKFTGRRSDAVIEVGKLPDDGRSTTEVSSSPSSDLRPSSSPVFFVRDNGVGFDMQYADKLFTPFQRLHAITDFPGSGIGLATVQRVLHRHGGRIWFDSLPDHGTTFFFTIGAGA